MAKSLRSKIKRRYRKAKRQYIDATVVTDRVNQSYAKIQNALRGIVTDKPRAKNAFLYPDHQDAIFPKRQLTNLVDFRSEVLPLSGSAASGCRRKYDPQEKLQLGLVVHCIDGHLDVEKRMLINRQQNGSSSVQYEESSTTSAPTLDFEIPDEHSLVMSMKRVSLVPTSRCQSEENDLQLMNKHQDRISGRSRHPAFKRPVVINKLRSKEV